MERRTECWFFFVIWCPPPFRNKAGVWEFAGNRERGANTERGERPGELRATRVSDKEADTREKKGKRGNASSPPLHLIYVPLVNTIVGYVCFATEEGGEGEGEKGEKCKERGR